MPPHSNIVRYAPAPRPSKPWFYVMTCLEQQLLLIDAIDKSPEPMATMKVWLAVTANLEIGTNMVAATVTQIAGHAKVTVSQASRALAQLHQIGALERIGRGRYKVNAHIAYRGPLAEREAAASNVVPLR
jgi:hypothetical protein